MAIMQKLLGDFIAKGQEVDFNGGKIRPGVKVSVAAAMVKSIDENNGNANVVFSVEGAKYTLSGYVNTQETAFKIIEEAYEKKVPVAVRLERKRKKHVAPDRDINEITVDMNIARENITKTFVGVYDYHTEKWILTREAQSNPDEDDPSILSGLNSVNVNIDNFFSNPAQPNNGPIVSNANKELENKENALMNMYFFVIEQAREQKVKLDNPTAKAMAVKLLEIANYLQVQMFELEAPVYSAYSHTRARYVVFKVVEVFAKINDNTIKDLNSWSKKVAVGSKQIWEWSRNESSSIM